MEKRRLIKIHCLLLGIALFLFIPVSAQALNEGDRLPPFTAKDIDGKSIDLSALIGKRPLLLVFWASWCPNCKNEVPRINKLVEKYRYQGMEFIGINVGVNDSIAKVRRFMSESGMSYPVIFDSTGKISRQFGIVGVPTILVTDKKGIIVFKNYATPEITSESFNQLNL